MAVAERAAVFLAGALAMLSVVVVLQRMEPRDHCTELLGTVTCEFYPRPVDR